MCAPLAWACRLAGELGAAGAKGPGSLRVGLLDHLYCMSEQEVTGGIRLKAGTP